MKKRKAGEPLANDARLVECVCTLVTPSLLPRFLPFASPPLIFSSSSSSRFIFIISRMIFLTVFS